MLLTDRQITYMVKDYARLQKHLDSKESKGTFRAVARQEAIVLTFNLSGWNFDRNKMQPFKRTQAEKREYFDANS